MSFKQPTENALTLLLFSVRRLSLKHSHQAQFVTVKHQGSTTKFLLRPQSVPTHLLTTQNQHDLKDSSTSYFKEAHFFGNAHDGPTI
jgi:hypothetical protein